MYMRRRGAYEKELVIHVFIISLFMKKVFVIQCVFIKKYINTLFFMNQYICPGLSNMCTSSPSPKQCKINSCIKHHYKF